MRWLVLFVVCSCAHVNVPCIGVTGVQFLDEAEHPLWTCEYFIEADQKILKGFHKHKTLDNRLDNIVDLRGWKLSVVHANNWDHYGKKIVGITYCDVRTMYIAQRPFGENAITHEYAHAIQLCSPREPIAEDSDGHDNWLRDGIGPAISNIDRER